MLTDDQVDFLNQSNEVVETRQKYLSHLAEGFKAGNSEAVTEAHSLLFPVYLEIFRARLQWVEDNPT